MKLTKVLEQLDESKFSVGEKIKMMPKDGEGTRGIPVEVIQVLAGRCKILIIDGARKGEEELVWNFRLHKM